MKKIISGILAGAMVISMLTVTGTSVYAETTDGTVKTTDAAQGNGYEQYINDYNTDSAATDSVKQAVAKEVTDTSVTFNIDIPKSGLYTIGMDYKALDEGTSNLVLGIKIDGSYPFDEAKKLEFPRMWEFDGGFRTDGLGNEFSPEIKAVEDTKLKYAKDISGWSTNKYLINLEAGSHSVEVIPDEGSFYLENFVFGVPEKIQDYTKGTGESYQGEQIVIEGEDADMLSSYWLISRSDNTNAGVHPASKTTNKVNYIGGSTWKSAGETITWLVDIETSGYYQIGFTYRQASLINCNTYRSLKVDGEIPFIEAEEISFAYGTSWQNKTFADENGNAYMIYLEAGTREISLEATPGPVAQVSQLLNDSVAELGDLYMDITMITGETVDNYRSYDLFNSVSNMEERITACYENLKKATETLESIGKNGSGSYDSTIKAMLQVLQKMFDNKYNSHRYVSDYYSKYCSLASVLNEMRDMPLDIDRIILASPEEEIEYDDVGIFSKMSFSVNKFFRSFISDYNNISGVSKEDESLTIWVNWGRDQAQILNSLIQSSFTPETGISVDVKVTNATIVQSVLSNNQPDVILQQARSEPVNLAMRNVLLDLKEFDDLDEVLTRFQDGADEPYRYRDGLYALPDTQTFYLMFYRTDIFEEMGIEVPETWDDFVSVTKLLARNNLQTWLHYTQITSLTLVNTGIGSLNIFPSMLMQNNLSLFSEDKRSTTLTDTETIKVFEFWSDFYTKLKIPKTLSFYNRFRTGTCPIGIEQYTTYTTLKAAAPEIDGLWSVAEIPGTVQEDGSVSHISSGGGTGCAILKSTENKEAAWEFLKWWTSEDIQVAYANNLESVLGPTGRIAVANVNAFKRLSWDSEMKATIIEAWKQVREVPEVPGSYYVSRSVDLSFWNVVNENLNPKDILLKWGAEVNDEIERKWKQYENR